MFPDSPESSRPPDSFTTETAVRHRSDPPADPSYKTLLVYSGGDVAVVRVRRGTSVVFGRKLPSTFIIDNSVVSRRHARFTHDRHGLWVEDLGSRNGTRVRGQAIKHTRLGPGDQVEIGDARVLVFEPESQNTEFKFCTYDELTEKLNIELASVEERGGSVALILFSAHGGDSHVSRWLPDVAEAIPASGQIAIYSSNSLLVLAPDMGQALAHALACEVVARLDGSLQARAGVAAAAGPCSEHELLARAVQASRIATPAERVRIAAQLSADATPTRLVVKSPAMQGMTEMARKVAAFDLPLLIHGETGSGKEVIAHLIHESSPRKRRELVVVNCAAIPESLIESTLFGHEKGAFTGASQRSLGAFERADGGTLFLDEIGELSAAAQADLLRVLETKTFSRVGSTAELSVDVRVLAATHRDLEHMVGNGNFRQDLLYRLNAVVIEVPPLRERPDDVDALTDAFLLEFSRSSKLQRAISPDARRCLRIYRWPGNVRELKNVIERAAVLCRSNVIEPADLPRSVHMPAPAPVPAAGSSPPSSSGSEPPGASNLPFKDRMREFEAELIRQALERSDGNRTKTAELLGLPLRTLNHKMKSLGIK
jgi:two-component system, NtrC family, response regulator AtoC